MRLEGTLNLERKRTQRWVPIVAIVVPVVLCVGGTAWFVRAFVAPPMAPIPAPIAVTAAPPPERPAAPRAAAPQPAQIASAAAMAYAGTAEPTTSATLPMFATFALAPPGASLRTAPPATVDPELSTVPPPPPVVQADSPSPAPATSVASLPDGPAASPAPPPAGSMAGALGAGEPLAGSIPLPPERRQLSAAQTEVRVPLPRARPLEEASSTVTEAERRTFSAHGSE